MEKKELLTRVRPNSSLLELYYEGGGELPKDLQGQYTSEKEAQKAVTRYLIKRDKIRNATSS